MTIQTAIAIAYKSNGPLRRAATALDGLTVGSAEAVSAMFTVGDLIPTYAEFTADEFVAAMYTRGARWSSNVLRRLERNEHQEMLEIVRTVRPHLGQVNYAGHPITHLWLAGRVGRATLEIDVDGVRHHLQGLEALRVARALAAAATA